MNNVSQLLTSATRWLTLLLLFGSTGFSSAQILSNGFANGYKRSLGSAPLLAVLTPAAGRYAPVDAEVKEATRPRTVVHRNSSEPANQALNLVCTQPTDVSATATPSPIVAGKTLTLRAFATGVSSGSTTYTWSGLGITAPITTTASSITVAAPSLSGVYGYDVLISNGESCTAIANAYVIVREPCTMTVSVGTPTCASATNQYTATGTISLSNTPAGSLTITDNGTTIGVVAVTSGQTSATFTVSGASNASSHTLTVTSSSSLCSLATQTYQAPASCLVCQNLTVTPNALPNGQANTFYSQTLSASGGQGPYSYSIIGGSPPANLSLSAGGNLSGTPLTSGISSFTVKVTDQNSCSAVMPYTLIIGMGPVCSLSATATPGPCQGRNTYTLTGNVSAQNSSATQSLTISVGTLFTTVTLNGSGPVAYTLTGLPTTGSSQTATIVSSIGACEVTNPTFTAPASCTAVLDLDKRVSASKAKLGDVLTYTVTVANKSSVASTSLIVNDVLSSGAQLLPSSVVLSAGTFTTTVSGGSWSLASVPGSTTVSLVFSASLTGDGVIYNTASMPGDIAKVCTTVPVQVCKGSPISIQLDAPEGFTRYQWYLTTPGGTTLVSDITVDGSNNSTANLYTATRPGEYQVVVDDGVAGACPDLSCCPVIVEEVEVPSYRILVKSPPCESRKLVGTGQFTLSGLGDQPEKFTYQLSRGGSFDANTATAVRQVPAGGILTNELPPATYTVRVYNAVGCYRDETAKVNDNCACKPDLCLPVTIVKTKTLALIR